MLIEKIFSGKNIRGFGNVEQFFVMLSLGIFFVTNDAIINYLSQTDVQFYHFIFYGIPIFLCFPFYFLINVTLKKHLKCTIYFLPIFRGFLNIPLPFYEHRLLKFRHHQCQINSLVTFLQILQIDLASTLNHRLLLVPYL